MFERAIDLLKHFWFAPVTPGQRMRLLLLCAILGALLAPRLSRLGGFVDAQSQVPLAWPLLGAVLAGTLGFTFPRVALPISLLLVIYAAAA